MIRALPLALVLALPVEARVLEGAITAQDGAGRFVLIPEGELPLWVGEDAFDDPNLYAFVEAQSLVLASSLPVDVAPAGRAEILAGTVVASHFVLFDGVGGRQRGYVDFDAPILGVAAQDESLAASDGLAGTDILYARADLRGIEEGDRVWIDPDLPTRLWVDWAGSSPGDHLRVFTEAPPLM